MTSESALSPPDAPELYYVDETSGCTKYLDYIAGEESLTEKPLSIWSKIGRFFALRLKLAHVLTGKYEIQSNINHSDACSGLLVELCKDDNVKSYQVVRLIEMGADPNYDRGSNADTPIFWLARHGKLKIMKYLIKAGASVNVLNVHACNPLMAASESMRDQATQARVVRFLLTQKGVVNRIDARDAGGNSALMNAIFHSNVWVVRELLLAGASVLDEGFAGTSAYDAAKWIYASGIGLEAHAIPKFLLEPDSTCYKFTSPDGYYKSWLVVYWQMWWKYHAELVFRMVHRRKREERHFVPKEKAKYRAPRPAPPEESAAKRAEAEKSRRAKKLLERRKRKKAEELEHWNQTRRDIASRIDDAYSRRLRGMKDTELTEWVRNSEAVRAQSKEVWTEKPKPTTTVYSAPPSVDFKLKPEEVTMERLVEEEYNRTHEGGDKIDLHKKSPEEQYKERIGLQRDAKSGEWGVPSNLPSLGFVDRRSVWARLRKHARVPAIPEDLEADSGDSEDEKKGQG